MKQLVMYILMFLMVNIAGYCEKIVPWEDLELRDELLYLGESEIPFTGAAEILNSWDHSRKVSNVLDGKETMSYREYDENGRLQLESHYVGEDEQTVRVTSYYENGQIYEISTRIKDGRYWTMGGEHREYYENGQLRYIRYFGMDHHYKEYYESGQLKEEGEYIGYHKEGQWCEYYENGQLASIKNFKQGDFHGIYEIYHYNGALKVKGVFTEDKSEGEWIYYYDDGQLSRKMNFQDGMTQGDYKSYYKNGNLESHIKFNNGYRDGKYIMNYENGHMEERGIYKGGKMVETKAYLENGDLSYDIRIDEDGYIEEGKAWHLNGKVGMSAYSSEEEGRIVEYYDYRGKLRKKVWIDRKYLEEKVQLIDYVFGDTSIEGNEYLHLIPNRKGELWRRSKLIKSVKNIVPSHYSQTDTIKYNSLMEEEVTEVRNRFTRQKKYNYLGQLISIDMDWNTILFDYDEKGRLVKSRNIDHLDTLLDLRKYEYDRRGRLESIYSTTPDKENILKVEFGYDRKGRLTKIVEYTDNEEIDWEMSYSYDKQGKVVRQELIEGDEKLITEVTYTSDTVEYVNYLVGVRNSSGSYKYTDEEILYSKKYSPHGSNPYRTKEYTYY